MNQPPAAESILRESSCTYTDPYLGQTLGEAKAVTSVAIRGDLVTIELVLGFPCADMGLNWSWRFDRTLGPRSVVQDWSLNSVRRSPRTQFNAR